jgi:thioredoxin-related protein
MLSRTGRILAVLVVPALVLAASSASAQAPAKKTLPTKAAAAEPLPPIFDPDALGTKAVDSAIEVSNQTSRRIFVVLGTNDCPPCRVFNDVLHEQEFFKDFIKQFVPVLIDVSPKGPNVDFLKNYRIDTKKGFPAVAIFESDTVAPLITRNGEMVKVVKKGPDAIRTWIRSYFKTKGEEPEKK